MESGKLLYGILAGIFGVAVHFWRSGKAKKNEAKEGAEKFTWQQYIRDEWPVYIASLALVAATAFRYVIPADYTLLKWEWLKGVLTEMHTLVHAFPGFTFFCVGYMGNDVALFALGKTKTYLQNWVKKHSEENKKEG